MDNPNFKYLSKAALLLSALALGACGSDSDDDTKTPTEPTNNAPSVSISGDSSVTEGESITVDADASDSDGTITSYAWHIISGPDISLSGEDTASVSFTVPDIEDDVELVLELIVTDNDGATSKANFTVMLERKELAVTITGVVTDEPIDSSNVVVQVGDEVFEVIADENGNYSLEIAVDDSNANKLVKLVAIGNTAINPEVEFVSQLKSMTTLLSQAGGDGMLTKDENFGVNITNVSTAEFALIMRDSGEVASEEELNKALLAIDADEKLQLAALIKIIVDNDDYELPEDVGSTLELISNADDIDNFVNTVQSKDPALIETIKKAIKDDEELIDTSVTALAGDYIMLAPKFYQASLAQLSFNADNTGYVSFVDVDAAFSWQQQNADVTISLPEPQQISCSFASNEMGVQEQRCSYLVDMSMSILLENDANRSVEFSASYEDRWVTSETVINSYQETGNYSLIEKAKTITVAADELVGTWVMDNMSDFYGFSSAVSFAFNEDGTGTLFNNDMAPVAVTWQLSGNQLLINSEAESPSFNYAVWLVKDISVGYQFVASLNDKQSAQTRTATGLMVKDNELSFSREQLLGKWTVYQGYNSAQNDLHYDVYDDGLLNFNLDQNFRSWQLSSDGEFIRHNFFTSHGVQPVCPEEETCQVYSEFSQRLLAEDNNQFFTYRTYRFYNPDGSERVQDYSSHLRNFTVSNDYGVKRFAPYWLEGNQGYDENGFPIDVNFVELYSVKDSGIQSINIATTYNSELEENEYNITFNYMGESTSSEYRLESGKLLYSDMQVEISDFDRDFLTVCVAAQGAICPAANQQNWYFDAAKAQQQVNTERPEPAHPLDGAWQLVDEPDVVVVLRDSKWIQVQSLAQDDIDDGFAGYEYGDFTWNAETGEFSVQLEEDTNGNFGLNDTGAKTATVDGDVMTLNIEGEGEIIFSRIYNPSNPLIGAYFEGSITNGDFFMSVFKEDGYFIEFEHASDYQPGITGGLYTAESSSGALSVTVDYYINQLDDMEDIDPYFVVKPEGNKLIWHDGDEFGVMQRVTDVESQELSFTAQDVIGQHVLRYVTDDGTGLVDLPIEISEDGRARFVINSEQRDVQWSIELGQLKLYSPSEIEGDSAYGVMILPKSTLPDGFTVSAFGFEAPDDHPDQEDPELFISVMGSMLKQ